MASGHAGRRCDASASTPITAPVPAPFSWNPCSSSTGACLDADLIHLLLLPPSLFKTQICKLS